jgi:hypothetical protein
MRFFCVQLCSGRLLLDNCDLDELIELSEEMCGARERKRTVKGSCFEGQIRTEFTSYAIGSISGTLFVAELDVNGSLAPVKIHYLVRELPKEWHDVPRNAVHTEWAVVPAPDHECPPPLYAN